MVDENAWPNHSLPYEYPFFTPETNQHWQQALDGAIGDGVLALDPLEHDLTHLHGDCPRCGHHMEQALRFKVYGPGAAPPTFNVVCNCREGHRHPVSTDPGCGWALELVVTIAPPTQES